MTGFACSAQKSVIRVVFRAMLVVDLGCGADADAFEADFAAPADLAEVGITGVFPSGAVNPAIALSLSRRAIPRHRSAVLPSFSRSPNTPRALVPGSEEDAGDDVTGVHGQVHLAVVLKYVD